MVKSEFVGRVMYFYNAWLPARVLVQDAVAKRNEVGHAGVLVLIPLCFDDTMSLA